jgi:Ca-activated chloride channel family protein
MGTTAGTSEGSGSDRRDDVGLGGIGPWLRLFLGISSGAVAIAVSLGLVVLLTSAAAHARPGVDTPAPSATQSERGPIDPAAEAVLRRLQAHHGSGLILMAGGDQMVAPLQSTDALLRVTGNTVRAIVTQRFRNPGTEWLEGTYLFPLPDDAAVDHLRMKVGDKVIEGQIREKQAARREFADARRQGRRATLLEQQRPNAFTTEVTNIAPGATIEIEIEYQQTVALRDGAWRLRFPGVVAPRYRTPWRADSAGAPPEDDEREQVTHDGPVEVAGYHDTVDGIAADASWQPPRMRQGILLADAGADAYLASDLYQPLLPPDDAPLNPFRITVEIDAGVPLVQPVSASHRLQVSSQAANAAGGGIRYRLQTVADAESQEFADRDFELEWSPAAAALPMATLRHERHGGGYYGILVINAPSPGAGNGARLPREMTFVVDTSGSMGGESIEQARSALSFGLQRLHAGDRFNIIQFNSRHSSLFPTPLPATPTNLRTARRYVNGLRADGGTEMRGAIAQALSADLPAGFLGQVVFITDGAVDYEDELVSLVRERLDARRLFTVGIGSAPNGFFMRKAAAIGGGTFTFIGKTNEVERRMAQLFEKLAHPMSTGLAVTFDGGVLAEPLDLPRDLYAGEPLVVAAHFRELPRAIEVSGVAGIEPGATPGGGRRWRIPVEASAAPDSGLHVLWARSRIETLSDAIRQARHTASPQDALREQVVRLALEHHLVSAYTSLVAVDLTPVRPMDEPLLHGAVPANLPAGWDHEALTGQERAASRQAFTTMPGAPGPVLARTATPAPLQLLIGVILLAIGFLLLLSRRGSRFLAAGKAR